MMEPAQMLARLLQSPNQVRRRPSECVSPIAREAIVAAEPSLQAFEEGDISIPVLLPVVTTSGVTWYGCARNAAEARELGALLNAWIGPSWSDFCGAQAELDDGCWPEGQLREAFGPFVFRLRLIGDTSAGQVAARVAAMLQTLRRRPSPLTRASPTPGRLRAEFDRALLQQDAPRAASTLEVLRGLGLLSRENLKFVEVRMLAGLGQWENLYALPDLRSLADLRLPPETYADVVEAVYRHYFAEYEVQGDLDSAISIAQTAAFRRFAALFRSRRGSTRPAVLKAFLLWELASDRGSSEACRELLAALTPTSLETRLRTAIERHLPALSSGRTLGSALAAFEEGRLEEALAAYVSLPADVRSVQGALRAARELETADAARTALNYLESSPADIREQAEARAPRAVAALRDAVKSTPALLADGWLQWANGLKQGGDLDAALDVIREKSRGWPTSAMTEADATDFSAALIAIYVDYPELGEQLFPIVYEAFVAQREQYLASHRPVYAALISVLRIGTSVTRSELDLARDVLVAFLSSGPGAAAYRNTVQEVAGLLETYKSFTYLDWAIDVCDVLSVAPCTEAAARSSVVATTFALAEQFRHRLTPVQTEMLTMLSHELGTTLSEFVAPATRGGDVREVETSAAPITSRIAIYSLDSAAAARARSLVEKLLPHATIEVNHDTVCTDRLRNLARNSDIVAFTWKSSSHAAFYCVKDNQGPRTRLCLPTGAGSTSLVRAICEAAAAPVDTVH